MSLARWGHSGGSVACAVLLFVTATAAAQATGRVARAHADVATGTRTVGSLKPGVGPAGLTSARLCGLVTASGVKALLNGAAPEAGTGPNDGSPNSQVAGQAKCTWADARGDSDSLTISTNPGISGCNGQQGTVIHQGGWAGCWVKTRGLFAYEGVYYLSLPPRSDSLSRRNLNQQWKRSSPRS